jgi:TonB family protein
VPYYFKGLNLLSDSQTVHGKEVVPLEASQVFQKYLELAPAGQYAALTRQTLQFIAGNLVTTYSKTSSPDRPSADQHKGEPRRDIPEGAANMFILRKVQPSYPELARNARIQGPVIFDALISEDGDILSVGVLAGNPFLVQAALDAVKQWKYNRFPFIREPATVQTQIWVNFALTSEPQPGPVRATPTERFGSRSRRFTDTRVQGLFRYDRSHRASASRGGRQRRRRAGHQEQSPVSWHFHALLEATFSPCCCECLANQSRNKCVGK